MSTDMTAATPSQWSHLSPHHSRLAAGPSQQSPSMMSPRWLSGPAGGPAMFGTTPSPYSGGAPSVSESGLGAESGWTQPGCVSVLGTLETGFSSAKAVSASFGHSLLDASNMAGGGSSLAPESATGPSGRLGTDVRSQRRAMLANGNLRSATAGPPSAEATAGVRARPVSARPVTERRAGGPSSTGPLRPRSAGSAASAVLAGSRPEAPRRSPAVTRAQLDGPRSARTVTSAPAAFTVTADGNLQPVRPQQRMPAARPVSSRRMPWESATEAALPARPSTARSARAGGHSLPLPVQQRVLSPPARRTPPVLMSQASPTQGSRTRADVACVSLSPSTTVSKAASVASTSRPGTSDSSARTLHLKTVSDQFTDEGGSRQLSQGVRSRPVRGNGRYNSVDFAPERMAPSRPLRPGHAAAGSMPAAARALAGLEVLEVKASKPRPTSYGPQNSAARARRGGVRNDAGAGSSQALEAVVARKPARGAWR